MYICPERSAHRTANDKLDSMQGNERKVYALTHRSIYLPLYTVEVVAIMYVQIMGCALENLIEISRKMCFVRAHVFIMIAHQTRVLIIILLRNAPEFVLVSFAKRTI